jgi:hypothetical protein
MMSDSEQFVLVELVVIEQDDVTRNDHNQPITVSVPVVSDAFDTYEEALKETPNNSFDNYSVVAIPAQNTDD